MAAAAAKKARPRRIQSSPTIRPTQPEIRAPARAGDPAREPRRADRRSRAGSRVSDAVGEGDADHGERIDRNPSGRDVEPGEGGGLAPARGEAGEAEAERGRVCSEPRRTRRRTGRRSP